MLRETQNIGYFITNVNEDTLFRKISPCFC